MNLKRIIPLFLSVTLMSCNQSGTPLESKLFCFDTVIETKLYQGDENNIKEIEAILSSYDKLTDNYKARDVSNVFSINLSNEDVVVDPKLYDLLKTSISLKDQGVKYFNPLCGSLAKKWKESLKIPQILDENTINSELLKISISSLSFKDNNVVQRIGEAEIDLGGIAKGWALDDVKSYFQDKGLTQYLVNAGSSSILLGEKNSNDGYFSVGLKDLTNTYIKAKNCFVSTSGVSTQGVKIDDKMYSHIINPENGSAECQYDAVIVLSDKGYLGDALSTSMMMNTIDEIKDLETSLNVKTIVIKNKTVVYKNESIEVLSH